MENAKDFIFLLVQRSMRYNQVYDNLNIENISELLNENKINMLQRFENMKESNRKSYEENDKLESLVSKIDKSMYQVKKKPLLGKNSH